MPSNPLNRTLLELKQKKSDEQFHLRHALNRTLLELKQLSNIERAGIIHSLNRTLLELKRCNRRPENTRWNSQSNLIGIETHYELSNL